MAKGPFKMKGSPMQRNFGISPLHDHEKDEEGNVIKHEDEELSEEAKKFKALTKKISLAQKRSKLRKAGVKVEDPGGPILP